MRTAPPSRARSSTRRWASSPRHSNGLCCTQDPLGLDRVYMQAKRYARDNVVQRPAIQGFIGALFGFQGDRGVFITTRTSFTAGARHEAERVNARIVLIDGNRLAELMVRHGVRVQAESTAVLHRIDEGFFDMLSRASEVPISRLRHGQGRESHWRIRAEESRTKRFRR
jgi:restriction system protein